MGNEDDGSLELDQIALQPLQRGDVEMVRGLVEQQQVGAGGERTSKRGAGQLAAGEGREPPPRRLLAETETAEHGEDVVAPAVAAAGFEPLLRRGVGAHRLLVGLALRHRLLQARQLRLGLLHVGAAGEDVLAEGDLGIARRSLVVQRDPRPFLQGDAAGVRRPLPGEDPEQGRLAGAVAPGERHPLARLELEGDVGEEQRPTRVDVDRGCGRDCHGSPDTTRLGPRGRNLHWVEREQLREVQAPLKERYREEPAAAVVTLEASGELGEGVSCSVQTGRAIAEAGLHPASGGDGSQLCSGDMLLEALVACAGVTLRAVATSLGIEVRSGTVRPRASSTSAARSRSIARRRSASPRSASPSNSTATPTRRSWRRC